MRRLTSRGLKLSALTLAALACAPGCADDASARGEDDALAFIDGPSDAEAGDAGSVDDTLLDAGTAPAIDGGEAVDASSLDAHVSGPVIVPSPQGSYFASIIANGTGCPAGSWNTAISEDGQRFAITFSSYEVNINNTVPDLTITKNCTLNIKMHSPKGLSYSVKSLFFSGYSFLEEGVSAAVWARYYFQGNPVPPINSNRVVLTGPYDSDFVFKDEIKTADAVWSPCGVDRELIINTTLQLRNSKPKRSGYANIASPDGSTAIQLELAWRGCNSWTEPAVLTH